MSDLKTAFRAMRGHPGFSTIVILTMAVGIAVNAAIFSVYDRLVLHPVTIPDPSSLVAIWFNNPQRNTRTPSSSVPRYDELRAEVRMVSQGSTRRRRLRFSPRWTRTWRKVSERSGWWPR